MSSDQVGASPTPTSATDQLETLCGQFRAKVQEAIGKPFPDDAKEQLWGAIGAVFQSWNGRRAISYRRIEGIPDEWGTAINVQAMVFGNMGDDSATGVAFTRNPATGENEFFGEWLTNAQGEDVVAGIRTPNPLNIATKSEHTAAPEEPRRGHARDVQDARRHPQHASKSITATCRTSSSRSRRASSGCSRRVPASGPARPP